MPVTVTISGEPAGYLPGVTADADITLMQKSQVLTVPSAAVHTSGTHTFVDEVVDGRSVSHDVHVGAVGTNVTQIVSGLSAGAEGDGARLTGSTLTDFETSLDMEIRCGVRSCDACCSTSWFIADTDDKKRGRLDIINHLLGQIRYEPLTPLKVSLPKQQKTNVYEEPKLSLQHVPALF